MLYSDLHIHVRLGYYISLAATIPAADFLEHLIYCDRYDSVDMVWDRIAVSIYLPSPRRDNFSIRLLLSFFG